jgi:hypothetical protein
MAELRLNLPQFSFDYGSSARSSAPAAFDIPALQPGEWKNPEPPKRNLFTAGVSAGVDELQGLGGRAAEAVGRLSGIGALERWGGDVATRNAAEAAKNGRPDLEALPWSEGGPGYLPWLAYQASKQIPLLAGMTAAGAATGGLAPAGFLGASGAAAGAAARLPAVLGGQGLRAGATAAEAVAAREAASSALRFGAGAAVPGYVTGVGSLYGAAKDREEAGGGEATAGDAAKALALGVPYAALEAVQPTALRGMFKSGTASSLTDGIGGLKGTAARIAERIAVGAAKGAATEAPTEGAQTALEQYFFRGDQSPGEQARAVLDGFLAGGAVGGVFGGAVGGFRRIQQQNPAAVTNEDLATIVDSVGPDGKRLALPPPNQTPMFVNSLGGATRDPNEAFTAGQSATLTPDQIAADTAQQAGIAAQQGTELGQDPRTAELLNAAPAFAAADEAADGQPPNYARAVEHGHQAPRTGPGAARGRRRGGPRRQGPVDP